MPYGLYISAEGAMAQTRRLEVIANNLANVDTSGFKRDVVQLQARDAEAIQQGLDYPGMRSENNVGGGVQVRETSIDLSPGVMKQTGRDADFAIQGEGFFVVRKGNQEYLTRAGNFSITSTGALTTSEGYPVLSSDGEPVTIDPNQPWNLSAEGAVTQDGVSVPLKLVKPQAPGDLAKSGQNLFLPLAQTVAAPAGERRVAQGYLEGSAVKSVTEMMSLIEASRAFEANVSMIRNQDNLLGTLINRVLIGQ